VDVLVANGFAPDIDGKYFNDGRRCWVRTDGTFYITTGATWTIRGAEGGDPLFTAVASVADSLHHDVDMAARHT
jgi:hypothetical protein